MLSERFELRFTADLLRQIDDWRRKQSDLPSRAEAIRRLIETALKSEQRVRINGGKQGAPNEIESSGNPKGTRKRAVSRVGKRDLA